MKKQLVWQLGCSDDIYSSPNQFFHAKVPGAVQVDYAAAHNLPDYKFETNYEEYRWMEEKFWIYKTSFDVSGITSGKLFFVSKGIDFKYDIFVNGDKKLSYEGVYHEAKSPFMKFVMNQE